MQTRKLKPLIVQKPHYYFIYSRYLYKKEKKKEKKRMKTYYKTKCYVLKIVIS